MSVKLLIEHYLELLSLKGGCTGSYEATLVKMPHCWKSGVTAHIILQAPGSQISAQQQKERREQQIRRLKEFNFKKRNEKVNCTRCCGQQDDIFLE